MALRFDNQTAVVTGASHGFGKDYATFLASLGANIVVNDSFNPSFADDVVETIRADGGRAIANYDKVENGEKIIEAGVSTFGRIDILINNADISRDLTFSQLEDDDWNAILRVSIKGAFKCSKAAWPYFKKQKYGRLISTTSMNSHARNSGRPCDNATTFAQLGFTQTIAREGSKYNILANVIKPVSERRHSVATDILKAELITPFVAMLVHSSNNVESGSLCEVGGGICAKLRWERAKGALLRPDRTMTAGTLLRKWSEINDFSEPSYPIAVADFNDLLKRSQVLESSDRDNTVRLDGKVALVTGAGAGLGRAYALHLAELGARVVVNDVANPDRVIQEIKAAGGQAIANVCPVEDGDKVVQAVIKAYGRVDIIINNAGFVRDKSISNMTDELWDSVMAVHMWGAFKVTKAAWPYFLKQEYGRVVNVSSTSGIYGNFGQSNYSTAKCGIIGFSEALAREGAPHNIRVNTIAPVASTPALAVAVQGSSKDFLPEYIAPFVALICSEIAPVSPSAGLFELGVGWHARTRLQRSGGTELILEDGRLTEEAIQRMLTRVSNFDCDGMDCPENAADAPKTTVTRLRALDQKTTTAGLLQKIEKAKAARAAATVFEYSHRDVILYNLGIGATCKDLHLVYETNRNFQALPTFGAITYFNSTLAFPISEIVPNWDPTKLLHGEHYLSIRQFHIPTSAKLVTTARLLKVLDKGKAAVVVIGYTTRDAATGDEIFYNEASMYVRGSGGFDRLAQSAQQTHQGPATNSRSYKPPRRKPDTVAEERTSPEQAALYRLSGDYNPMHIDPDVSAKGGFATPLLHGLCFFGISGKHVYQTYGAIKSIKVRFASTVAPGETLKTEMWKGEGGSIVFQTRVVETGKLCIVGGGAELWPESEGRSKL